jgi:RNA polymerase sigma-70 factor (ECF subfamily)
MTIRGTGFGKGRVVRSDFDEAADLLSRAARGDPEARRLVVERFQDRLLKRIRRQLGPALRDFTESADCLQDVFLEIFKERSHPPFQTEEDFLRWASRLLENRIRDLARRRKLRVFEALASSLVLRRSPDGSSQATPSSVAARNEDVERLRDALRALPPEYRLVIELRDLDLLDYKTIVSRMDRSADAVQMLHARALARLSSLLGARDAGPGRNGNG